MVATNKLQQFQQNTWTTFKQFVTVEDDIILHFSFLLIMWTFLNQLPD